jgi:hypothetical protein
MDKLSVVAPQQSPQIVLEEIVATTITATLLLQTPTLLMLALEFQLIILLYAMMVTSALLICVILLTLLDHLLAITISILSHTLSITSAPKLLLAVLLAALQILASTPQSTVSVVIFAATTFVTQL